MTMKQELLDTAKEFNTSFLTPFPHVQDPVTQIAKFNTALNHYAQQATEQGETIHAITTLLSNPHLEAYASEQQQALANQKAPTSTAEAREVVWGDVEHNLAGLKELVNKLLSDLEAATP